MPLTSPPDDAEREAALKRLPAVRASAASRRRHRRALATGAAVGLVLAVVMVVGLVARQGNNVRVTAGPHAGLAVPGVSSTAGAAWPTPRPPTFRSNKPEAQALLERMQSDFVPPPGSAVNHGAPPAAIDHPVSVIGGALLTTHQLWTVPGSPEMALTFLEGHLVRGAAFGGSDGALDGLLPPYLDEDVAGSNVRGLVSIAAAQGVGGSAIIRVDYEVAYTPERPPDEAITTADHFVSVTRTVEAARAPTSYRKVSFSDAATVVGLANAFNGLTPASSGGLGGWDVALQSCRCPSPTAPSAYTTGRTLPGDGMWRFSRVGVLHGCLRSVGRGAPRLRG